MKRFVALCGALVLTLVMAAPAAALQKVHIEQESGSFAFPDEDFGVEVSLSNPFWTSPEFFGSDWACRDKSIYYQIKFRTDLWLWYPNGVAEADMMPEGEAWPWVKGKFKDRGTDYFAANEAMTKKVLAGKYNGNGRTYDHVIGNPESWKAQVSGKGWGITVPGSGQTLHEAGKFQFMIEQEFDPTTGEIIWFMFTPLDFRGKSTFDYDALCDYYDAGPAVFLP